MGADVDVAQVYQPFLFLSLVCNMFELDSNTGLIQQKPLPQVSPALCFVKNNASDIVGDSKSLENVKYLKTL